MKTYTKQPYITEQAYVKHPAGSKVLASKDYQGVVLLEFEDGFNVRILNGWCRGLEEPPYQEGFWDRAIKKEIDAEILGELDTIIENAKEDL